LEKAAFRSTLFSVLNEMSPVEPTQSRTRLVLLDEMLLFRASLGRFLALQPGLEVAGECGGSKEALQLLRTQRADLVLLDLRFAGESAEEFFVRSRNAGYRGRFLIVTGVANSWAAASAIASGASGIFLKSDASARLVQAIRLVAAGAVWIDPKILRLMAGRLFDLDRQSKRASKDAAANRHAAHSFR
jgi:DNA-binding NarL/FixJ family response regulator